MIEQLRCRAVRTPMGAGSDAVSVLRTLAGSPRLVCLLGAWAGGGALIASDPLATATDIEAFARHPVVAPSDDDDVVGGGWFGWLAFSGEHRLAFYDHVLRFTEGQWWFEALWSEQRDAALAERREEFAAAISLPPIEAKPVELGRFAGPDAETHLRAVETAIGSIRAGEIYQVNVCTRLSAATSASGIDVFARLANLQPVFGAYLDGGDGELASASPELFLRRRGRQVVTKPIKGTLPRATPGNDLALRRSTKDAAENVMIVDLMRNDLGRVCEYGSVRASSLLDVEAHPGVWHLVSTVEGQLRTDVDDAALLRATFPPGSVTGTPKLRALTEIAALESVSRGAYTGAIGFASPLRRAEFNVTIRTFELSGERIDLGVGGGVTADSVPMLEWRECLHKAAPLLDALGAEVIDPPMPAMQSWQRAGGLLETILVVSGRALRLADHLARLDRSCREVFGHGCPSDLAHRVNEAVTAATPRAVLRIVLTPDAADVSCTPLGPTPCATPVYVVRRGSGLWRHKWADRGGFAADEARGTPLYIADDGAVLETSRGNVFLLGEDGSLVTAPLRDDVLPGVTRRAVLDIARDAGWNVELRTFALEELRASAAFWTSSLSGAVVIESVDGIPLPRLDDAVAALRARVLGVRSV